MAAVLLIGIPLATHDGIFFDIPELEVISELGP
ncbi:hypothetical protein BMS3Abin02_00420 [bacterium BMS3Abin02]|nr:hypothetical protein BMS3Abin02_00420 [bacterium BMS3Abin02]